MPIHKDLRHLYRGPTWEAARAACRDRAGDRCEQCGCTNGTVAMFLRKRGRRCVTQCIGIQCGAAHLNNIAGDDRPENLAWLCRGCHLHRDQSFHRLTRATRKDAARPLLTPFTGEKHAATN